MNICNIKYYLFEMLASLAFASQGTYLPDNTAAEFAAGYLWGTMSVD